MKVHSLLQDFWACILVYCVVTYHKKCNGGSILLCYMNGVNICAFSSVLSTKRYS